MQIACFIKLNSLYSENTNHPTQGNEMKIQDIINTKQAELNMLNLAYCKCPSCGFIKLSDCYIAINNIVCCNLCGNEIQD